MNEHLWDALFFGLGVLVAAPFAFWFGRYRRELADEKPWWEFRR